MQIEKISIRNFRRLESVSTTIEGRETVFVGPNNSGKTSATTVFRCFLGERKFQIYDFSVSKIVDIDEFGVDGDEEKLPGIELDIWFRVDPESIEFGRAFTLLPTLSDDFERLGVRLTFRASDATKLRESYLAAYPTEGDEAPADSLSEFLAKDSNLARYFEISYAALEETGDDITATPLDSAEGKNLLRSLIRIDFVEAQRNIDDEEEHRANRLSSAFAGFYRSNLKQIEAAAEAQKVIDEHNEKLSAHYATQFSGLMDVIKGLGVPSVNDRDLQIVSALSPETALRGNTNLLYVDKERNHKLPEVYNGLGFKNLIYMAIQAKHYHSQWLQTPVNRPLCHLVFIEEPEVHLHAQVQQTFIRNIWDVLEASADAEGDQGLVPQLIVTTHSSHILDATDFAKVRYFRRCRLDGDDQDAKILSATEIHSLRDFQPSAVEIGDQTATQEEALEFLKKYLRLTHCDLFFADAAILVEGAAEKLLLPAMIDRCANELNVSYLTVLEIGGAYAHRFDELLSFIKVPFLIITDLDSVSAEGNHPACRADEEAALTSNASLKQLLGVSTVAELNALTVENKTDEAKNRYVSFQGAATVVEDGVEVSMCARTLEEAIAYQNFALLRSGDLNIGAGIPDDLHDAYDVVFNRISSRNFKKTDFAMSLLDSNIDWETPSYIAEGLQWLKGCLHEETAAA